MQPIHEKKRKIKNPQEIYFLSVVFLILLLLVWMVFVNNITALDDRFFAWISLHTSAGLTSFMKAITFFGNHKFLIPANFTLIAVLLLLKKRKEALTVFIVAISSLLLKLGLKELFHRPRPANPMVEGITNFSFPSGHALMSIAFYGLLIWLLQQYVHNKAIRYSLTVFLVSFILLIGFSRIYLRVHYATDVLAGYCFGMAWLWCCLKISIGGLKKNQGV
jgi:undecaprenyl-diphosphatase